MLRNMRNLKQKKKYGTGKLITNGNFFVQVFMQRPMTQIRKEAKKVKHHILADFFEIQTSITNVV